MHVFVVDNYLHKTGVVTKIDKGHATVVTTTIDPTGERHLLTDEFPRSLRLHDVFYKPSGSCFPYSLFSND